MRRILLSVLIGLLMIAGLVLLLIEPIQTLMVKNVSQQVQSQVLDYTPAEIQAHVEQEAEFNFEAVQPLSIWDVLKAQASIKNLPAIGSIHIPEVHLTLPVIKGVGAAALAAGAGTMKANQAMGMGNYSLASHYIEGKNILFGPLYQLEVGDFIYLTDKEFMYEYTTIEIRVIEATEVSIIQDEEQKTLLTLITCAEEGEKRLAVRAEFVRKTANGQS